MALSSDGTAPHIPLLRGRRGRAPFARERYRDMNRGARVPLADAAASWPAYARRHRRDIAADAQPLAELLANRRGNALAVVAHHEVHAAAQARQGERGLRPPRVQLEV